MARVTNITRGPRFVYAGGRPTLLKAGETRDCPLRDAEIANVQQQVDAGMLAWDGDAPLPKVDGAAGDGEGEGMTAQQLIDAAGSMNFMKWKSAAAKVLMDATPATKEDILGALEAVVQKAKAEQGGQA